MKQGDMYLITDMNDINMVNMNAFIISITEDGNPYGLRNILSGSVLLPPYETMMYLSDGDQIRARDSYIAYLSNSPEVDLFLTVLVQACIVNDKQLLIYVPKDEFELGFFTVLSEYISNVYGIVIGCDRFGFWYNAVYDSVNFTNMYLKGLIGVEEFILYYPPNTLFTEPVVWKALYDMHIPIKEGVDYMTWLYQYKLEVTKNNNTILPRGLISLDSYN